MIKGSSYRFNGKFIKMIGIRLVIISIAIGLAENSVVQLNGRRAKRSLYDPNDQVFLLNSTNFYQSVFDQPYASFVEFYRTSCGHCRGFAPIYKAFASDVQFGWNDVLHVSAIDCEANFDVCDFGHMKLLAVPTLRYFPPFYRNDSNHLGIEVQHIPRTVGEPHLFDLLANSSTVASAWPNLMPIESASILELFASLPKDVQYIFIVYDPNNESFATQKVALDLRKIRQVQVRRVGSAVIAANLGLNVQSAVYVGTKTTRNIELLKNLTKFYLNRDYVRSVVQHFLISEGVDISDAYPSSVSPNPPEVTNPDVGERNREIIEYVKSHPGVVFRSDLESAIHFSIFSESLRFYDLSDEQISALEGFISVLNKYSPLRNNGQRFLNALNTYVQGEVKLNGRELPKVLKELEAKYHPEFSSSSYIGCKGSTVNLRGASCGLWQLFHYLTIAATNSEKSHDPLEVLGAIHGFIKYFFSCTDCSEHFQDMAKRNGIWNVATKDAAVLWLWSAHNEVNRRLAGDSTEDPEFPKIQYPSQSACPQCYQEMDPAQSATPVGNNTPHWDTREVLHYLRRVYSASNLSRWGMDNSAILRPMSSGGAHLLSKFSEMDVRMGILLYAGCMLIIVKLFM